MTRHEIDELAPIDEELGLRKIMRLQQYGVRHVTVFQSGLTFTSYRDVGGGLCPGVRGLMGIANSPVDAIDRATFDQMYEAAIDIDPEIMTQWLDSEQE